jgi:hypothetical protein
MSISDVVRSAPRRCHSQHYVTPTRRRIVAPVHQICASVGLGRDGGDNLRFRPVVFASGMRQYTRLVRLDSSFGFAVPVRFFENTCKCL